MISQRSLMDYEIGAKVTETSKLSILNHPLKQSQEELMLSLYAHNSKGFTDFEMKKALLAYNIIIPLSSIAARRNGINRTMVEKKGCGQVILLYGEIRKNQTTGKFCRVWEYKKNGL